MNEIINMLEKEEGFPYSPELNKAINCIEGAIIFPDIFSSLETKRKISWPTESVCGKYYMTYEEYIKAINSFSHKKRKNVNKVPRKRHPLKPFICYEIGKQRFPSRDLLRKEVNGWGEEIFRSYHTIDFTLLCSKEKLIEIILKIIEEKA